MAWVPPSQEQAQTRPTLPSPGQLPPVGDPRVWLPPARGPGGELQETLERRKRDAEATAQAEDAARARIKGLPPDRRQALELGISRGAEVIDQWYAGALQAVGAFRSKLVSDQGSVGPALAGNLIWAATSIEVVPAKVLLSFFGATLGTLGTIPSSYDAVIGPVTGDVQKRLNDLRDNFVRRLDVILLPAVDRVGYEQFSALDHPKRLELIWTTLFRDIAWSATPTEATKAYVLANLQRADADALARLDLYRKAWSASLFPAGVDFYGAGYRFDAGIWQTYTNDPVWLYAGRPITQLDIFYVPHADPAGPLGLRDKRSAALLRLAIERLWPFP